MKRILFLSLFLLFAIVAFGQFTVSEAEITLQSRHVWRGSKLGDAPAIEPSITLSKGNFSLNFWAAKTLNKSYSEIDLIPSYQIGELTFSLYDYYVPEIGETNSFFNFRNGENRHTLEFSVDNYSGEKSKFKWMVGTFLTCDKNESTGNPFFSTYVEFKYPFSLLDIDAENIGEMEIVGDNVSIGYFKNDVLNSQKFEAKYEKRSFRTGDYGYFEDDMLFFANRKDELIKLHGYRIELGEIDREFLKDERISDAITIPLKRGTEVMKLITFIISKEEINSEELKNNISVTLPYYMVPSDIIFLGAFPYNNNHKIDKNKLIEIYKNL